MNQGRDPKLLGLNHICGELIYARFPPSRADRSERATRFPGRDSDADAVLVSIELWQVR